MRLIFGLMVMIFSLSLKAQIASPGNYNNDLQHQAFAHKSNFTDSAANKKWFINKYIGMYTSVCFFNGGNAMVQTVPIGIQVNRRLNHNWSTFGGLSAAPAYVNFSHPFISASANKFWQNNNLLTSSHFDLFSKAELGLMYINEQKTFSISGSIGVARSSYPFLPINQMSTFRPNTFISHNY